jgi:hypothetical protein
MAITLDKVVTSAVGAAATSFNDTTNLTLGGTTNVLIVALSFDPPVTNLSLSWNAVSLGSALTTVNNSGNAVELAAFGMKSPTTGNHALSGAWTTSSSIYWMAMGLISSDIADTRFVTSSGVIGSGNTSSVTIACPGGANDYAMSVGSADGSKTWSATTSGTNFFNDNSLTQNAWADQATGATSLVFSDTLTGTGNWVQVAIAATYAVAGGTFTVDAASSVETLRTELTDAD